MTEEQKEYIEQNIDLIEDGEWEKFFNQAPNGVGLPLYEAGVNFLKDVSEIFPRMFSYSDLTELVIPNNITSIGTDAFCNCTNLKSIELPEGLTNIGDDAFSFCESLSNINFPDSLTSIGINLFYHCKSLSRIEIPNSVTSIGDWAFYDCISLTSINIPASVKRIGHNAFYYCAKLTKAVVNNPNATFERGVFARVSSNFELYGYTGSTAEKYANANGHTFVAIDL